jgi:hypothetical protein
MATIRWCPIYPKWESYQPLSNLALLFHTLGGQWDDRDTLLEDVIYRPRKTDFAHPGKPILKSAECARQSLDLFEISSWAYRGPQKSPNHLLLGFRAYIYTYTLYIIKPSSKQKIPSKINVNRIFLEPTSDCLPNAAAAAHFWRWANSRHPSSPAESRVCLGFVGKIPHKGGAKNSNFTMVFVGDI